MRNSHSHSAQVLLSVILLMFLITSVVATLMPMLRRDINVRVLNEYGNIALWLAQAGFEKAKIDMLYCAGASCTVNCTGNWWPGTYKRPGSPNWWLYDLNPKDDKVTYRYQYEFTVPYWGSPDRVVISTGQVLGITDELYMYQDIYSLYSNILAERRVKATITGVSDNIGCGGVGGACTCTSYTKCCPAGGWVGASCPTATTICESSSWSCPSGCSAIGLSPMPCYDPGGGYTIKYGSVVCSETGGYLACGSTQACNPGTNETPYNICTGWSGQGGISCTGTVNNCACPTSCQPAYRSLDCSSRRFDFIDDDQTAYLVHGSWQELVP